MHEKREFIWIESGDRVSGFGRRRIMVPMGTQLHSHSLKLSGQSNHKSNLIFSSRQKISVLQKFIQIPSYVEVYWNLIFFKNFLIIILYRMIFFKPCVCILEFLNYHKKFEYSPLFYQTENFFSRNQKTQCSMLESTW